MWDEDDTSGRFIQLISGIVLLIVASCCGYLSLSGWDSYGYSSYGRGVATGLCLAALYVSIRCFWYAITGKNNINRDDF